MDRGRWTVCSLWRRSWVWGSERAGSLEAGGLEASTEGLFIPQLSKRLGCLKPDRVGGVPSCDMAIQGAVGRAVDWEPGSQDVPRHWSEPQCPHLRGMEQPFVNLWSQESLCRNHPGSWFKCRFLGPTPTHGIRPEGLARASAFNKPPFIFTKMIKGEEPLCSRWETVLLVRMGRPHGAPMRKA